MRNAPPVQYPVGLFLWGRRAVWGLWALIVLAGPALLWRSPHIGLSLVLSLPLALAMAWALHHYLRNVWLSCGQLYWEEGQWYCLHDEQLRPLAQLTVLWDAGDRIWLRWRMPVSGTAHWHEAWLLKRDAPLAWHLLRCVLMEHIGKNFTQPSHMT